MVVVYVYKSGRSVFFSGHQINLSSLRNNWSLHLDAVLTLTLINRIVDSEQWHWSTENSVAAERAGCLMYCTWCSGKWVYGHCVFCQIRISAWLSLIVKKCHVEDVLESGKRALYILSNQNVIIYCKAYYKGGRENESLKFIDNWQKKWPMNIFWLLMKENGMHNRKETKVQSECEEEGTKIDKSKNNGINVNINLGRQSA